MILSELQSLYKAQVVRGTEIQLKKSNKKKVSRRNINILMQNETHSLFPAVYEHSRTCCNLHACSAWASCSQMSTLATLLEACHL